MNVDTGKIDRYTEEELAAMSKEDRAKLVLIPDELVAAAETLNRKQRRHYQRLVERRGLAAELAMQRALAG